MTRQDVAETILIVEDSRTQAEALRLILEADDFSVEVVSDGQQALERIAGQKLDLILSDVFMPGMTGYELCRQVKTADTTASIPFVLATALSDPADIIQIANCGADNFVTKPYDAVRLVARVRAILEIHRRRSARSLDEPVDVTLLDRTVTVRAGADRLADLLLASYEEAVRINQELLARDIDLRAVTARAEQ